MRLRRAPREVYRLYDEDEYLAGVTWEQEQSTAVLATTSTGALRLRRAFSVAILLGVTGALGVVIALNTTVSQRVGSGRRLGLRYRPGASVLVASNGARQSAKPRSPDMAGLADRLAPRSRPAVAVAGSARLSVRLRHSAAPMHDWGVSRTEAATATRTSHAEIAASGSVLRVASATSEPAEFGFER
jgi:hypothetical protein